MSFSKETKAKFWDRQASAWAEPAHHPLVGVLSRKYDLAQVKAIREVLLPFRGLFEDASLRKLDLGSSGCGLPAYLGGDPDAEVPEEFLRDFIETNLAQFPNLVAADISRLALKQYQSPDRVQLNVDEVLPFATGCFDIIDLMFLTRYIKSAPLIPELDRLLAKNGKLIIIDFLTINHIHEVEIFDPWLWKDTLEGLGYKVVVTHLLPQPNPPNFDSKSHQLYSVVAEK